MPYAEEHADALQWRIYEIPEYLSVVGTIPGVVPLAVAGRNGPGLATIRSGPNGTELSFRAPGSNTFGADVDCSADGTYLLEDGEDASKWLRIQVYADYLPNGAEEGGVQLADRYEIDYYLDDVDASEASAGDVESFGIELVNVSLVGLSNLKIWIDPASPYLEIQDGAGWVSPISEADALELGDVGAGSSTYITVTIRRTIPANSESDPEVLSLLHVSFDGP